MSHATGGRDGLVVVLAPEIGPRKEIEGGATCNMGASDKTGRESTC